MVTGAVVAIGAIAGAAQASSQKKAAKKASDESARQFDITQRQLAPFRQGGTQAFEQLGALAGTKGVQAERAALRDFQESPGQQFLRERGQRALLRNAAKTGGLGGGNVRQALQEQAIGVASQQLGTRFNQLAGISAAGLQATSGLAQLRQNQASQQAGFTQQLGAIRSQAIGGIAGSLQSGIVAQQARSGFQSGLTSLGQRKAAAGAELDETFAQNPDLFG